MALKDNHISFISQSEGRGGTVTVVDDEETTANMAVATYWSDDPAANEPEREFHLHRRAAAEDFVRSQAVTGRANTANRSGVKIELRGNDGLWIQAPVHLDSDSGHLVVSAQRVTMA